MDSGIIKFIISAEITKPKIFAITTVKITSPQRMKAPNSVFCTLTNNSEWVFVRNYVKPNTRNVQREIASSYLCWIVSFNKFINNIYRANKRRWTARNEPLGCS